MVRPAKLDPSAVRSWLEAHPGWSEDGGALARTYALPDFAAALALAVRLGMLAERRDHHPDLHIGWGSLKVVWTTHDAGGITELDLAQAEATERLAG